MPKVSTAHISHETPVMLLDHHERVCRSIMIWYDTAERKSVIPIVNDGRNIKRQDTTSIGNITNVNI